MRGSAISSSEVTELTNRFYSYIPHISYDAKGGTRARLPLINNTRILKSKLEMCEALGNIELASRVIDVEGLDAHPIDAKYAQLRTRLSPVDKASDLHKMLQQYIANTHAETHSSYTLELTQAFEVQREGEAERFKDVGNRQLLWHGSRLSNWAGILSSGLRIAPPEAPATGYMFGKGVYFADMSSKSANYCFANRSSATGVLVLCEVSLGAQYERLSAEYEAAARCAAAKKHSTFGKGATAPDPAGAVTMPGDSGLHVPMGPATATGVKNSSLLYNEFIVYSESQIKQRYVLQVRFKFKGSG